MQPSTDNGMGSRLGRFVACTGANDSAAVLVVISFQSSVFSGRYVIPRTEL